MWGGMREILLGIHIFLAIIWVGGVLFIGWGVYPAARILPFRIQQRFFLSLMVHSHRFFTVAGIGVILTGVLLGTLVGPISQWGDIWTTAYGHTWISALVTAMITLLWGGVVSYKSSMKVFSHPALWKSAEAIHTGALKQAFFTIALIESVEVIGFIVLICFMVSF